MVWQYIYIHIFVYGRRIANKKQPEPSSEHIPGLNKPQLDATTPIDGPRLTYRGELDGTQRLSAGETALESDLGSDRSRISELPGSLVARVVSGVCESPGRGKSVGSLAKSGEDKVSAAPGLGGGCS